MLRSICLLLALTPGTTAATALPPLPLAPRETRNLTALTKLVGNVKYFYPNRHTAHVRWETVLVRSIPAVRRAPTAAALARTLDSLLRPLAPEVRIQVVPAAAPVLVAPPLPAAPAYYFWEHHGLGLDKTGLPVVRVMMRLAGLPYASAIREVPKAVADSLFPGGQHQYVAALTDSVRLVLPLVLTQTQHRQPLARQPGPRLRRLRAADAAHRLATVMLAWNIVQHFYPYREVLAEAQWEAALPLGLQQAALAPDEAGLLRACRTLLARLPDRHLGISPKTRTGLTISPPPWALRFTLLADSLVAVQQAPPALRPALAPGTLLTHVNGRPVRELLSETPRTTPATSAPVARRLAVENLVTSWASLAPAVTLTLQAGAAQPHTYRLRLRDARGSSYHQPAPVRALAPGIIYLDAARLRYPDFQMALPQLQAARGLVIDLRQRPTYELLRVLPHFSPTPLQPDSTATPYLRQPNFQQVVWQGARTRPIPPQAPLLLTPKVFLVGPNTFSYGETIAELVRRHHLGILLGQPTGGTNGEMNFAALGRAYLFSWTGRRVVARGPAYQGQGLAPDVLVQPTLSQVRQEQDADILGAVAWLTAQAR